MDNMQHIGHAKPLNVEDNNALYRRLVAGDVTARNEMIEGNTALAIFRVEAYLRTSPQMAYYRDDMISEALVGVCRAVDDMQKRGAVKHPRPTGYITRVVDHHIAKVVDERDTIVVPPRTQEKARRNNSPIESPKVVSEKALSGKAAPIPYSTSALLEVQEELLASCHDYLDRQIIAMRADGYTHEEIAEKCGLSRTPITRRIKAIGKRLVERCPEYRQYIVRGEND